MQPIAVNSAYFLMMSGLSVAGVTSDTAALAYTLQDAGGTAIAGGTGSFTASGSGGIYTALVGAAVTGLLTPGEEYTLVITVTVSGTLLDTRYLRARAIKRGAK